MSPQRSSGIGNSFHLCGSMAFESSGTKQRNTAETIKGKTRGRFKMQMTWKKQDQDGGEALITSSTRELS